MCEAHINDAVRNVFNVKKVTSSHTKGRCEILSEDTIPEDALRAAIDATGYRVTSFAAAPYEKKGLLRRLTGGK